MKLDIAYRTIPMPGETKNGDAVVTRCSGDRALLAVVDGLGHGPKAHDVARAAVEVLECAPLDAGILTIMEGLHDGLRGTRGAAATVCVVHGRMVEGCGVGNVELRHRRSELPVVLSPGVLGTRVRSFRCFRGELQPGARLLMYSDGISGRFALADFDSSPAEEACELVLQKCGRNSDDTTVLIADLEEHHDP